MVGFSGIVIGVVWGIQGVGRQFWVLGGAWKSRGGPKSGIRRVVVQRCGKRRSLSVKLLGDTYNTVVDEAGKFQGCWITW